MSIVFEIKRRAYLRNANIRVELDGRVVVTVPVTTRKGWINAFVEEKTRWIKKRQEENARLRHRFPPRRYINGEWFLYLGRNCPLVLSEALRKPVNLDEDGFLHLSMPASLEGTARSRFARSKMVLWYRERTRALVREPLRRMSKNLGVEVKGLRIHDSKAVWGSSSTRGNLNFTCRLAMAPLAVLEYLVVHELSHQVHMNHSAAFWRLVGQHCPQYRTHEKWLREVGRYLEI